jgi:hypothetical protein
MDRPRNAGSVVWTLPISIEQLFFFFNSLQDREKPHSHFYFLPVDYGKISLKNLKSGIYFFAMKQKRKIKKPIFLCAIFEIFLFFFFFLNLTGPDAGRDSPVVDRFTVGALR